MCEWEKDGDCIGVFLFMSTHGQSYPKVCNKEKATDVVIVPRCLVIRSILTLKNTVVRIRPRFFNGLLERGQDSHSLV
jgi:hypothetical protein